MDTNNNTSSKNPTDDLMVVDAAEGVSANPAQDVVSQNPPSDVPAPPASASSGGSAAAALAIASAFPAAAPNANLSPEDSALAEETAAAVAAAVVDSNPAPGAAASTTEEQPAARSTNSAHAMVASLLRGLSGVGTSTPGGLGVATAGAGAAASAQLPRGTSLGTAGASSIGTSVDGDAVAEAAAGSNKRALENGADADAAEAAPAKKSKHKKKSFAPRLPTKQNLATAVAALRSLAGSDSESSAPVSDVTTGSAAAAASKKNAAKGKTTKGPTATELMVDHSYTDYSLVDADTLAQLDEEQGLSKSGYEWPGLNRDPFPPRPDELNTTPQQARDMEVAMHNLQHRQAHDPAFQQEKEATVARLRDQFKGIRPGRRNSGGVVQPFPGKLMEVLDREDIADTIAWLPHGRAFQVHQPKTFAADILPRFFKQSKYMSFTRQLNLWGFKRITRGQDAGAYYHELFLRGRPRLTLRMRRQKIKGTGIKPTPNPDSEPNFYALMFDRPLPAPEKRKEGEGKSAPLPAKLQPFNPGDRKSGCNQPRKGEKASTAASMKAVVANAAALSAMRGEDEGEDEGMPPLPGGDVETLSTVTDREAKKATAAAPAAPAATTEGSKKKPAAGSAAKKPRKKQGLAAADTGAAAAPPAMPPIPPTGSATTLGPSGAAAGAPGAAGGSPGVSSSLTSEMLRRREQAVAESELQMQALLRLQTAELQQQQKQGIAAAHQGIGLLRQVEAAIPGAPVAPALSIPELQQRLLAAAAALDQPAVQQVVLEDQRRASIAALLAVAPTSPAAAAAGAGIGAILNGGGLAATAGLPANSNALELALLRQRLLAGANLPTSPAAAAAALAPVPGAGAVSESAKV